jgi:hypothetical protein
MSVESDCGIIVGLPYNSIIRADDEDTLLDDLITDGDLERSSCYYDSPRDQNIIGFWALYGDQTEFDLTSLGYEIQEAKTKFKDLTGQEGKVYVALHIT